MKRIFSIQIVFLLCSIFLVTCSSATQASSQNPVVVSQEVDVKAFLPMVTNKYPLISPFGIDAKADFNLVNGASAHWVRLNNNLLWSQIQPTSSPTYHWVNASSVENDLITLSQLGLEPLLIVRSTPEWAQKYPGKFCGPIREDSLPAFANFMREVVRRYSQPPFNVDYYHIWNEPDAPLELDGNSPFGCWGEKDDPYFGGEYYAEMLKYVYPAMRSANPNIRVVIGGLLLGCDPTSINEAGGSCTTEIAAREPKFFEGILKNSGGNYFDLVAFHGYAFYGVDKNPVWSERNHPFWSGNGGVVDGKIKFLKDTMTAYNVNKPILQTEAAILSGLISPQFEDVKADYVVWTVARNWAEGISATFWYSLTGWRGSGLVDADKNPLPAYHSFKAMATILDGVEFIAREPQTGYEKFVFRNAIHNIWVLVPVSEAYGVNQLISAPTGLVKVLNVYGEEQTTGATISFSRPIYLLMNR